MLFHQYELIDGTTHWIAWFDEEQLLDAQKKGWHILYAYMTTGLILNKEQRLVLPEA